MIIQWRLQLLLSLSLFGGQTYEYVNKIQYISETDSSGISITAGVCFNIYFVNVILQLASYNTFIILQKKGWFCNQPTFIQGKSKKFSNYKIALYRLRVSIWPELLQKRIGEKCQIFRIRTVTFNKALIKLLISLAHE